MKMKFEKNMRIISDILGYCYYLGSSDFHVDFSMDADTTHITIRAEIPDLDEAAVKEISSVLNTPRQRDMEQNYWNVTGSEDTEGELLLAGIMLDSASVMYQDGVLSILAERVHHSPLG